MESIQENFQIYFFGKLLASLIIIFIITITLQIMTFIIIIIIIILIMSSHLFLILYREDREASGARVLASRKPATMRGLIVYQ